MQQAEAALQQGEANENLAKVTAERWENLFDKGVVSRQDNDTYQMQYAGAAGQRAGARKGRGRGPQQRRGRRRPISPASTSCRATRPCARPSPA